MSALVRIPESSRTSSKIRKVLPITDVTDGNARRRSCYCTDEGNGQRTTAISTELSRCCAHSAIRFWVCTQQAPANCFLDESERLLGFTHFGFGCFCTELHRRQPVFSGFDTRLGLL